MARTPTARPVDAVNNFLRAVVRVFAANARDRVKLNLSGFVLKPRTGKAVKAVFSRVQKIKDGVIRAIIGIDPKSAWYIRFFEVSGRKEVRPSGRISKKTGKPITALRIALPGGRFIFRRKAAPFGPKPVLEPGVTQEMRARESAILDAMEKAALAVIPKRIFVKVR